MHELNTNFDAAIMEAMRISRVFHRNIYLERGYVQNLPVKYNLRRPNRGVCNQYSQQPAYSISCKGTFSIPVYLQGYGSCLIMAIYFSTRNEDDKKQYNDVIASATRISINHLE